MQYTRATYWEADYSEPEDDDIGTVKVELLFRGTVIDEFDVKRRWDETDQHCKDWVMEEASNHMRHELGEVTEFVDGLFLRLATLYYDNKPILDVTCTGTTLEAMSDIMCEDILYEVAYPGWGFDIWDWEYDGD